MFIPSLIYHRTGNSSCVKTVPDTFGILCWNVHKKNRKHAGFKPYLENSIGRKRVDFILLQEANFKNDRHCVLSNFAFDAAANLEIRGQFYGVLSASKIKSEKAQAYLSEGKESFIGTHKSLLVSTYSFEDGNKLLIFNVHAINFRETERYYKDLDRFIALMKDHKGPMIVAGDFNPWNKKRMQKLDEIRARLSLRIVPFKASDKVKSFMGHHLDFILYRGVDLIDYTVHNNHGFSDHNPLFAQFRKQDISTSAPTKQKKLV